MTVKKLYEERKVITLWGERGWHFHGDDDEYSKGSLLRGIRHLNEEVGTIAKHVTIQSVSHSQQTLPPYDPQGKSGLIMVTATIVYSGHLDIIQLFGAYEYDSDKPLKGDETVIQVRL